MKVFRTTQKMVILQYWFGSSQINIVESECKFKISTNFSIIVCTILLVYFVCTKFSAIILK